MAKIVRKFTNNQLADIFEKIASLLEIKGEVIYKILAYRKAAESLRNQSPEAMEMWKKGSLQEIPGIGKAIAEKIDELFTTGELGFLNRLSEEVPPSLVELLRIPDFGPKKAALVWKQSGITNLEELEKAARAGTLRGLPGMGEKSEAKIIAGIEALQRRSGRTPLGKAFQFYRELAAVLEKSSGVKKISPAGSLRRMRSTVGDLDIIVAAEDTAPVMEAFVNHPQVIRVIGHGDVKSSVEYDNGMRAQLWALPPDRFGTGLIYATGSKDHNVRLRELAIKQSWSLSEHALTRSDGETRLFETEEDVYAALGLPWIPPELREDRGEIQAALAGKMPQLVELDDLVAELHSHSTWSDGTLSIREMAGAAIQRGKKILAITDHSGSLGVAGGLSIEDLKEQRLEINQLQKEFGDKIRLLQGTEVEIRSDGTLDYPDDVLASLDLVIASLHSSLRQPREKVTERLVKAIRNPHVDIIGHPTGRLLPDREGADLDMEVVFGEAVENHVALEINAHPSRLDLDDLHAQRAVDLGIPLTINTDAHSASDMDLLHFGIGVARRGWVSAKAVINTWPEKKLSEWLARKA
jgi:DNA polymerase (family 10)